MSIFSELDRRNQTVGPIRIGVVGTGFFGAGLIRRIAAISGMVPVVAANRTLARALEAFRAAGIERSTIEVCDDAPSAQAALAHGRHVATSSLQLPAHLPAVDVIMEATGNPLIGAEVALDAINAGKHLVAANPETQATVGSILSTLANNAGVVYSDVLGDEPGNLNMLHAHCRGIGLDPIVAGNFKGMLNRYATPTSQAAFAHAHNLKPWIATAAADGTKLNLEMATVANATGLPPVERGMVGPSIADMESLISDFDRFGLLTRGPLVDYALGPFSGVFVIVRSEDHAVQQDFHYLKLGVGPWYVFHRPKLLLHYEAPLSAAEAVLHAAPTVAPRGFPVAEVVAIAKRKLKRGRRLDGIGGFDCYGLITMAQEAHLQDLLPMGLTEFAVLDADVDKDQPITRANVSFLEHNRLLELRQRQDSAVRAALPQSTASLPRRP